MYVTLPTLSSVPYILYTSVVSLLSGEIFILFTSRSREEGNISAKHKRGIVAFHVFSPVLQNTAFNSECFFVVWGSHKYSIPPLFIFYIYWFILSISKAILKTYLAWPWTKFYLKKKKTMEFVSIRICVRDCNVMSPSKQMIPNIISCLYFLGLRQDANRALILTDT